METGPGATGTPAFHRSKTACRVLKAVADNAWDYKPDVKDSQP